MHGLPHYTVWRCKIGVAGDEAYALLAPRSDLTMRRAVEVAFRTVTGRDREFIFSGWAGALTEGEAAFIERRDPIRSLPAERAGGAGAE
jgi:hypothetical protein